MGTTCRLQHGMLPVWGDSVGLKYWAFDGYLHSVGQASQANTPLLVHTVWGWDDLAERAVRLHSIDLPAFTDESEMLISTVIAGKLVAVGGTNGNQILVFDPAIAGYTAASWSVLVADLSLLVGARPMCQGSDCGGWFYIYGGRNNSTVYKTQTFTAWTALNNLPANLTRWCAGACFEHEGNNYLIGGAVNLASPYGNTEMLAAAVPGYVYRHNVIADTYTLLTTDQPKFGTIWIDGASNGTTMFVSPGYLGSTGQWSPAATRNGNQRGLHKSTDDGATWTTIDCVDGAAYRAETHRCGMTTDGVVVIMACGNFDNSCWELS